MKKVIWGNFLKKFFHPFQKLFEEVFGKSDFVKIVASKKERDL